MSLISLKVNLMNTASVHAFVTVMQTGSISRAAEKLFLTQPAVSKRLRLLENEFGVILFTQQQS